jgi:hypothetical protein
MLGALLMSMRKEGQIESVVMSRCPDRKFHSTLAHLLPAFEEEVKKKLEAKEPEANRGLGSYSEATCYEFHQLVVAAFLAYSSSLDTFCAAERKLSMKKAEDAAVMKDKDGRRMRGSEGMDEGDKPTVANTDAHGSKPKIADSRETLEDLIGLRNECAEQLWKCNFLLWHIAYSPIFYHHLVLLREGGWLHMQAEGHAELDPTQLRLSTSPCPCHKRAAGPYDGDKDAGIGKSEEKHGDVHDDDPEGLDEEFRFMRATSINSNLDETFKILLQLQVCEWAALETVSSFTRKLPAVPALYPSQTPPPKVRIYLLAVRHPSQASDKMEHWKTTLEKLSAEAALTPIAPRPLTSADSSKVLKIGGRALFFDSQTVIRFLDKKIDQCAKLNGSDPIFHAFKLQENSPNLYDLSSYGNVHCEATLACLMEYAGGLNSTTPHGMNLQELIKVTSNLRDLDFLQSDTLPRIPTNAHLECHSYAVQSARSSWRSWAAGPRILKYVATMPPLLQCSYRSGFLAMYWNRWLFVSRTICSEKSWS